MRCLEANRAIEDYGVRPRLTRCFYPCWASFPHASRRVSSLSSLSFLAVPNLALANLEPGNLLDLIGMNVYPAFKVKTTAPKLYCVRPNSGRIRPGQSLEVAVLLQPMKTDPPSDFKCRDKFLVQGVKIDNRLASMEDTEAAAKELSEVWTKAEARKKEDPAWADEAFAEHKLKVTFSPADPSNPHPPPSPVQSKTPTLSLPDSSSYLSASPSASLASARAANVPEDDDEKELIAKLKRENEGLRQRLGVKSVSFADSATMQAPAKGGKGGYGMLFVILVAILAFILGAIFF